MFGFLKGKKRRSVSLTEQLSVLERGGITLAPGHSASSLLSAHPIERFEDDPYRLLLCVLGDESEEQVELGEPTYRSEQIWHFDAECIEDHGDYKTIASRMAALAQRALPLEHIEDFVDVESGVAWLTFALDGVTHKWPATVDDDWVDPTIISRFAELLDSRHNGRRYTYIDLQGQDCLLGCSTAEQRAWLAENTGLSIEWLNPSHI